VFEKYKEEARRAIFFARHEAIQCKSDVIEWQHLLLGIVREGGAAQTFKLKSSEAAIRSWLPAAPEKAFDTTELPLSNASKRILAFTSEEARQLDHPYIFCDHMLLGLLREEESSKPLETLGLSLYAAREVVVASPVNRHEPPATPYQGSPLTFVQRHAVIFIVLALMIGVILGMQAKH
jgi:ATP-dependent Clp protease ATP-binding subunit ClpA